MGQNHGTSQKQLVLIASCVTLLAFVLVTCGSSGGTGPGSGTRPTPRPTFSQGSGFVPGCPRDTRVNAEPPVANLLVKLSDANRTRTAHVGDNIEIQLPFGLRWTGPTISGEGLQLQIPAGYALSSEGMCIWRLKALHAGTTDLTFSAMAVCTDGHPCPQFVLDVPFRIVTK